MAVWLSLIALIVGFFVLTVSADALVRGATSLALKLGLTPLVVGLTVVAFGTSAPELVVAIEAVLSNASDLALGNIVGSNIANVFLVLGLPAIIAPIAAGPSGTRNNAVIGLAAAAALILISVTGAVGWRVGAAFLLSLTAYLTFLFWRTRGNEAAAEALGAGLDPEEVKTADRPWPHVAILTILGPIGLVIGGSLIVQGGIGIANSLNIAPEVVGLTMVAVGTSLPELAATAVAAWRRRTDLAIGNVLGSNIFNILAVGGAAGLVSPFSSTGVVTVPAAFMRFDYWVMAAAAIALAASAFIGRGIGRRWGAAFLLTYFAYVAILAQTRGVPDGLN